MDDRTFTCLPRTPGLRAATFSAFLISIAPLVNAHPHVFVDGGIDFVFAEDGALQAVELTWLYDEFETLYMISRYGLNLNSKGALGDEERLKLIEELRVFPEDFDGSAHLSLDEEAVELDWPKDLDGHLLDGRLQVTFVRDLTTPLHVEGKEIKAAFYESTYFFAFKITNAPKILGHPGACQTEVIPFSPDPNDASLFAKLASLSREEKPEDENVGAQFADRISLRCAP